jgi:SnoaL-like domain
MLVTGVAHEIDSKQWTELTNLFAPRVETDYTSLFGGTPQTQTREDLVAGWRAALERVTTQHLLGPIDVFVEGSGPRPLVTCARFTTRRGRRAASTGKCSDTTSSRWSACRRAGRSPACGLTRSTKWVIATSSLLTTNPKTLLSPYSCLRPAARMTCLP